MNKGISRVKIIEQGLPLHIIVGKYIKQMGFDVANERGCGGYWDVGQELEAPWDVGIGILKRNPNITINPTGLLSRLYQAWFGRKRRLWLGTIWWSYRGHGVISSEQKNCASANCQNWLFDVYGNEDVELMKQLSKQLISTFNVNITLCVTSQESKVEANGGPGDYSFMN